MRVGTAALRTRGSYRSLSQACFTEDELGVLGMSAVGVAFYISYKVAAQPSQGEADGSRWRHS